MRRAGFGLLTVLLQNSATSALLPARGVAAFTHFSPRLSTKSSCGLKDTIMSSEAEGRHWEGMWSRGLKPGDAFDGESLMTLLVLECIRYSPFPFLPPFSSLSPPSLSALCSVKE